MQMTRTRHFPPTQLASVLAVSHAYPLRGELTVTADEAGPSAGVLVGADARVLDGAACAVELIHVYSLVHDDMPAMA